MKIPGRQYSATSGYRYGFNGKEKDKDIHPLTDYDYGFRIYNPGLGRFLSVDPLSYDYPWNSPYSYAENDVVRSIDLEGGESKIVNVKVIVDDNKQVVATYKSVQNGNNCNKLGNGVLFKLTVQPRVEINGRSGNAIVKSGKSMSVYYQIEGGLNFRPSIGLVVFGSGSGEDATMGGEVGGDAKILSVLDLNDENTKNLFELVDIMGKLEGQEIMPGEVSAKFPELVSEFSNLTLEEKNKKQSQSNTVEPNTSLENKKTATVGLPLKLDPTTLSPQKIYPNPGKIYLPRTSTPWGTKLYPGGDSIGRYWHGKFPNDTIYFNPPSSSSNDSTKNKANENKRGF
jgi:RHS repeat-associated protein